MAEKIGDGYIDVAVKVDDDEAVSGLEQTEKRLSAKGKDVGKKTGDAIGDGIGDGIKRNKAPQNAMDSVAKRANTQFKALAFAGMFAGLPAAAAVAGAGVAAGLAAGPLAMVAAGGLLLATNERVARSYSALADTAVASIKRAAQPMEDELVRGVDDLRGTVADLEPVMRGAFENSTPAINGVVRGVDRLAHNALPGFVASTRETSTVMEGVVSLLDSTGRGVDDFFRTLSQGSAGSVGIMRTLGGVVEDTLGFAGQLFANLATNGGPAFDKLRTAMQQVYGIVLSLTGPGFGALNGAFSGFMSVMSGALGVLNAVAPLLGSWLGPLAGVAGAFKALNVISFGQLGAQFDGIGQRVKDADGWKSKMGAVGSGLAGAMNGATLAMGAAGVGLALLGMAQDKAAQKAAQHKQHVSDLATALRESKGAIDSNVRAIQAKRLAEQEVGNSGEKLFEVAKRQKIPLDLLTDASLGNAAAMDRVNQILTQQQLARETATVADTDGYRAAVKLGNGAQYLQGQLTNLQGPFQQAVQEGKDLAAAAGDSSAAMEQLSPATATAKAAVAKLEGAFVTLYDPMKGVEEKGGAIIAILDRLAGRAPSYEEAIQSNNDTLRALSESLDDAGFAADGMGKALLNADGTVNTATKNGSALQDTVVKLQGGFANAASSIQTLVEGGMTWEAASGKVRGELQRQRDEFVKTATRILGNRDAAERLADQYGLLPGKVTTLVTDTGSAVATQKDVQGLQNKLVALPPNTPVRVTSITAEAEQRLNDLGYKVTHMPDGTVTVSANTAPAYDGVARFIRDNNGKTITIIANVKSGAGFGAGSMLTNTMSHDGGYIGQVRQRRTGGPTPALQGLANATLVGETGPEVIFPSRSGYVATAVQTKRMERDASAASRSYGHVAAKGESPAQQININVSVHPTPSMDVEALTVKVARTIERRLKGGS